PRWRSSSGCPAAGGIPRSPRSPRWRTTSGSSSPSSACSTVPRATPPSARRRDGRSWTACGPSSAAHASRCSRPSCGAGRAITRKSSSGRASSGSRRRASTAGGWRSPRCRCSTVIASTTSTSWWPRWRQTQRRAILDGNDRALAVLRQRLEAGDGSDLGAFTTERPCEACGGERLNPRARAVRLNGQRIAEFTRLAVADAERAVRALRFDTRDAAIAEGALKEILPRLGFLGQVGLGYLTLDRRADTLSGGEAQRIRLAAQLGSNLRGVCYILDEPTIGLHPRDGSMLLDTLETLRARGNTVIVVEHDEATIRRADLVVDLGPG